MQANGPHYLLFSEASARADQRRNWRFVLRSVSGDQSLAAADVEPGIDGGRLELLAVVRGLEALPQPSRVTLLTRSRYVSRGIRRGLGQWRDRQWRWERFGKLVPIRDHDLWRRVDRALRIHQVECYPWQSDRPRPCGRVAEAAVARCRKDSAASRLATGTDFADESTGEAAVLIVPRHRRLDPPHGRPPRPVFSRALRRLGQAVSAWLTSIRRLAPASRPPGRPALTRAA